VDGRTIASEIKKGLSPLKSLQNNDSNAFFKMIGGSLVYTGSTGTNVNDLAALLVMGEYG
jgi:glycerate-2-kinase